MRRRLAVALLTIGLVAGAAGPAAAAPAQGKEVSGPVTGPAMFTGVSDRPAGCSFAGGELNLTFDTKGDRSGILSVVGCVSTACCPGTFPFAGRFVLTAPNGATLTGTATSQDLLAPLPFEIMLHVESGTKQLKKLVGRQILLSSPNYSVGFSRFSGTLETL